MKGWILDKGVNIRINILEIAKFLERNPDALITCEDWEDTCIHFYISGFENDD